MRLKNNLLRALNNELVIVFAFGLFTTFVLYLIYTSNVQEQNYSLINFFSWMAESIHSLLIYSDFKSKILIALFCILLPLGVYLCCIAYIIKYIIAVKKLSEGVYIKFVNLLSDKICFNYNKSSYDFVCSFNKIKNLDMEISISKMNVYSNTLLTGSGYIINNIIFKFIKFDNSELSVCVTPFPFYVTSFIFSIIDYCKKNGIYLTYKFVHMDGKISPITEEMQKQIDNYKNYGRPKLTENEKLILVVFSGLLYLLGIGLILYFKNNVVNFPEDFGLIIFLMPIFCSLVMDIFYIIDKIQNQFKNSEINNILEKYYELFSFIKILLAICIIAFCFIQ